MAHPQQIPLTPQTDERNFPRWKDNAEPGKSGCHYPKMLTRTVTRQDRDEWVEKHRRVDQNTRQEYWEEAPPRVGAQMPMWTTQDMVDEGLAEVANQPVIARDKEDEVRIRVFLGLDKPAEGPKSTIIPIAGPSNNEWVEAPAPVKKRGRPKKVALENSQ